MRWTPEDERQGLAVMTTTQEDLAFQEFCNQLGTVLENYLVSSAGADASHRARRALDALARATDNVNNGAQCAASWN